MTITINGTTGIAGVDGSASSPAAQGADTNTGIFYGTDVVGVSTGGAERMRVGSTGTVSIATTSTPVNIFGVNGSGSFSSGGNVADAGGGIYFAANGVNYTPMSGVKGILANTASTEDQGGLAFLTRPIGAAGQVLTERVRITAGGDIYCGQTSYSFGTNPTTGTDIVAGGLIINAGRRTTGAAGNTLWDSAGVFYRSTSSLKYKRDVTDMEYGLANVMSLRPVTFASKSEVDGDNRFGGLIAEEVDAAGLREFVMYDQSGDPDGLQYANMVALCIKAIQELSVKNDALEARLAALEAK